MKNDDHQGQGGSFVIRDGKRVRVEQPTRNTDTGGARDASGRPLPGTVPPDRKPEPTPVEAAPAARQTRKPAAE